MFLVVVVLCAGVWTGERRTGEEGEREWEMVRSVSFGSCFCTVMLHSVEL